MEIVGPLDPRNIISKRIESLRLTLSFLAAFNGDASQQTLHGILVVGKVRLSRELELSLHRSLDEIERLQILLGPAVSSVLKFNGNALAYREIIRKIEENDLQISIREKTEKPAPVDPETGVLKLEPQPLTEKTSALASVNSK